MNIHNTPTVQTQAKQQSSTYLVVGISYETTISSCVLIPAFFEKAKNFEICVSWKNNNTRS
jgi:hypothetical protein